MPASVMVLDFTNVKDAGNFSPKHKPEGDYKARITDVNDHIKERDGRKEKQWVFTIQLLNDKTATYPLYCQPDEKTLWKVRNLFIAAGKEVPKKKLKVDPNKVVGSEIGIHLEDDEYDGKIKSTITATFPVDEVEEEEEEAKPARRTTAKRKAAPVEEDVDDEDVEEEEEEEEEEEPPPPPRKKAAAKRTVKKKPAPVEDDEDEDLEIDDL